MRLVQGQHWSEVDERLSPKGLQCKRQTFKLLNLIVKSHE